MRISDWSSDVCSSDLYSGLPFCNDDPGRSSTRPFGRGDPAGSMPSPGRSGGASSRAIRYRRYGCGKGLGPELQGTSLRAAHGEAITPARHNLGRSEEHTSELQSLMRISYAVF